MASDVSKSDPPSKGGPKTTSHEDWLFGYAPRRRLLAGLFGPTANHADICDKGLSAAQLAGLAGYCRSSAPPDIESLEALGLLRRERVGKRDRFFPLADCKLASSLCTLLESLQRLETPPKS